jgi:hypothetical protein
VTGAERSLELLRKAAAQFRFYETNHRAKAVNWERVHEDGDLPMSSAIKKAIGDTKAKAEANAAMAAELEAHIAFLEEDGA